MVDGVNDSVNDNFDAHVRHVNIVAPRIEDVSC